MSQTDASRLWVNAQAEIPATLIKEIQNSEKISPIILSLILKRLGGRVDAVSRYLRPELKNLNNPQTFPDIKLATQRLAQAIVQKQKVFIHGDYDVDGICACTLLTLFLRQLGVEVKPFVPERETDGYGVSKRAIEEAKAWGARLLITADCGVTAMDEIAFANTLGIDVIVTDHHQPKSELPKALAVVNPNRVDSQAAFKGLCGTGVAFFVCIALRSLLREQNQLPEGLPDIREFLDLVALATIADVVPLVEDNRILVAKGLQVISQGKRPGIAALMEVSGLAGKKVSAMDVAFRLIPRINACGRIGKASDGLELMLTQDPNQARALAQKLQDLNEQRKTMVKQIVAESRAQIAQHHPASGRALVLASETWHPGVLGVVAAKLVEAFHCPTAVISFKNGEGVGSLRTVFGIDLLPALESASQHLIRFGGHPSACGLAIAAEKIDPFRQTFSNYFSQFSDDVFVPRFSYDAQVELSQVNADFLTELEFLEPFGEKNPEPLFAALNTQAVEMRRVGEHHLKMRCRGNNATPPANPIDAIFFNFQREFPDQNQGLDLLFFPRWNEFNGRRNIQLELKDIRASAT